MQIQTSSDFLPARRISHKDFVQAIKKLGLISSLMNVQKLSAMMANQTGINIQLKFDFRVAPPVKGSILLSRDFVSFFAKHIVLFAGGNGGYNEVDLVKFVYDYNNMQTDLDELNPKDPKAWLWVLRATNHQWIYLRLPETVLGRYFYLYSKVFSDNSFREKIAKALGMDIFDLSKIGFCIAANYAPRDDGNYADSFLMSSYTDTDIRELRSLLSKQNIMIFMEHFAIERRGFKRKSRKHSLRNPRFKKYEFNALRRYPVIKTKSEELNEQYIIPSLPDFIFAFSEGLYYLLLDVLDGDSDRQKLFQKMGAAFEEYVGDLIRYYDIPASTGAVLLREQSYPTSNGEVRSADWILITKDYVYQIECKKRKPNNYARAGVEGNDGKGINNLLKDVAGQLDKLVSKKEHIESGMLPAIKYDKQKFVNVLVYLDEMFAIDEYGIEAIKKKMSKELPEDTYIFGSYEFELVCQHQKNTGKSLKAAIEDVRGGNVSNVFRIDFLSEEYGKFSKSLGVKK